MSAAFDTQQLADDLKPLKVARREAFVFPAYRRRMSEHADESAVVTAGGKPIVRNGETLLLGMVPLERRYAIGPVINGKAEVLHQNDFAVEQEKVYVAEYALRGQAPDNVRLRYVPNVVDFVAMKVDPQNDARLTHLGYRPDLAPGKEPEPTEIETLRTKNDIQEMQLIEMQKKLDELAALMQEKMGAKTIDDESATHAKDTAPCGRNVTAGYVNQHIERCQKPECLEARNS